MLVDTYQFGKIQVPVESIHKRNILRVCSYTIIRAARDHKGGALEEGWLLIQRNGKYAIYTSIEAAIRAYHKAIRLYGDKHRGELADLLVLGTEANRFMRRIMESEHLDKEARQTTESILVGLAAILSGDSDGHKQAARGQLRAAASPVDQLGRRNPARQGLLLAQARNHLQERTKEVGRIKELILPWLVAMGAYYRERVLALRELKDGLEYLFDSIWWDCHNADRISDADRQKVRILCDHLIDRTKILNVEPFVACRDMVIGDLCYVRALIRRHQDREARRSLGHAYAGARIGLARVRLESIRVQLELHAERNIFPPLRPETVASWARDQRERLVGFLDNLQQVVGFDPDIHRLDQVETLVDQADHILETSGPVSEVVILLSHAVALL